MVCIYLDTGPLAVITNPKKLPETVALLQWAANHGGAGNRIYVPAVADYELRRELTRVQKSSSIASLDAWNGASTDRYIPVTDTALRLASALWAQARNAGTPTADPKELDGDVLIATQVLDHQRTLAPGNRFVVATVNVGHLQQFVPADVWQNIPA